MDEKPLPVPPRGPTRSPPGAKDRFTKVTCPRCGFRTGAELAGGDVRVYCFNCKALITVSMHVAGPEREDSKVESGRPPQAADVPRR